MNDLLNYCYCFLSRYLSKETSKGKGGFIPFPRILMQSEITNNPRSIR